MRQLSTFLLLVLATSCSAASDKDTKLDDVSGFCGEWAADACNSTVVSQCGSTTGACVQAQQQFCETLVPDGKYSSSHAKDCLKAVGNAYKDGTLTADERDTVLRLGNECAKVLSGPGGTDAPCTVDSDCNQDSNLSCVTKGSVAGKCETPVVVGAGLDCSAASAVCGPGFYCDGANCIGGKAPGKGCSTSVPCSSDAHCVVGASAGTDGGAGADGGAAENGGAATSTCVARIATGACTIDDDCTSRICSIAAGAQAGRCVASPPPLGATDQICVALGT